VRTIAAGVALLTCACGFSAPSNNSDAQLSDRPLLPLDILPPNTCPANYVAAGADNSQYRFSSTGKTWSEAQYECETEGTHLIVIDGLDASAEVDYVRSLLSPGEVVWIGLSDHQAEATFRWVTGGVHAAATPSWGGMQPNPGKVEDCAQLKHDRKLYDASCTTVERFICECDSRNTVANPTWCETGTLTSCDTCTDDCDAQFDEGPSCNSSHTCTGD
jgi:hypothetical protein